MRRVFPLLLLVFYTSFAEEKKNVHEKKENDYAFYYPLTTNSEESCKVCLAINKDLLPARIKVFFNNQTSEDILEPHIADSDYSCWNVEAPKQRKDYYYDPSKIKIEIETKDKDIKFKGENEITVTGDEDQVFIETDRRVYKMGDVVKMRFLALGYDFKPIKNYQIKSLAIKSPYPSSATVAQWDNISTKSGLAQLEFQLAPDTPEGVWTINGDKIYTSFEVKKYVLPRFEAILTGPGTVYNGSESVSYTVCGKYSYGRNIKGKALLKIQAKYGYPQKHTEVTQLKDLKNGCAVFEFFLADLELEKNNAWSLDLTGTITERDTQQAESTSKYVYINRQPFSYSWDYESRYIKPELPYTGKFSVTDAKIPLKSTRFQLCYKLDRQEGPCSNFTLDSNNNIIFTIPPIKNLPEDADIVVEASSPDAPLQYYPSMNLNIWNTTSGNAIKIDRIDDGPQNCGSTLKFSVKYNSQHLKKGQNIEFKYMLTSRSEIVTTGSVLNEPKKEKLNLEEYPNVIGGAEYKSSTNDIIDKFEFEITLDKAIYTSSKLLIYYVYDNEVISDLINIDIKKCTPNKVTAKWLETPLYPGETGSLSIKADSESLCSISSIDKASTFLGSNAQINAETVIGRFNRYSYSNQLNCIEPKQPDVTTTPQSNTTEEPLITLPVFRPYHRLYSSAFDSHEAFKEGSVGVISNLEFISKICKEIPIYHYSHVAALGAAAPESVAFSTVAEPHVKTQVADSVTPADNRGSAVRSFFPETWLWELVPIEETGEVILERKLPDSITDWLGHVICVSSDKGFGISEDIEMKGFKPFFVDMLLPYSIKRNKEILQLPMSIFNYLNDSLPIRVTLESNDGLVLLDGEEKRSIQMCLAAEDSYTHTYRIKATKLGNINVTVAADVDPAYAEKCSPKSVIRRRDVVQKSLLVEPEGYPSGILKSVLLCANDSLGAENVKWKIDLPENVVTDTVDGKVIINSDILGPMFQNLENTLVVPTGCGEQTMATLTPNLYVLKYLEANKALTEKTKEKILKNLQIGYQRMLNYMHTDGSFSAFGKSDKDGSMFLTAFVIRTFLKMKEYIFIDEDVINKAITWVQSHQFENGCMDPVHHVFHEMGLASSQNQTVALTSYVLISFLETNAKVDDKVLANAKECIVQDKTLDKYTLAISSYALGLLNESTEAKIRIDKLIELSENKDDLRWWKQSENSLPANVEVSSYVIMSLLHQDPVANLGTVSSVVRWLQSQMNPRGGFFSTTDTVVGLDAISRYASLVNRKEPNVKVHVRTIDESKDIEITKRDRTKTEILPLKSYPNEIEANIQGDGCVSIQAVVNFYLDKPVVTDDLKLDINLKPVNENTKCSLVELKSCISYVATGQINMAILEVAMPSGYEADQASLYEVISNKMAKKFEQIKNKVVFYLTQLTATEVCIAIKIEENLVVENTANATIKLYDYYKPELSVSKSFKLEDCQDKP